MSKGALFEDNEMVSEETRKRWQERIEFLTATDAIDRLSEWENDFVDSIQIRLSQGKDLTLNQSSKLNQIFHKVEEMIG